MQTLSFQFTPSPGERDHQVRVLIDGDDIVRGLDATELGVDPPEFFSQAALREGGELVIGRCYCGELGCDDVIVVVSRTEATVTWTLTRRPKTTYVFERSTYDRAVETAANDHHWESIERTAERFVGGLDFAAILPSDWMLQWVSGRDGSDRLRVCLWNGSTQRILDAPWDHRVAEEAVPIVRDLLRRTFDRC